MSDETASPTSKADLLDTMREGRAEWDALLAQIPEKAMMQPVLNDGWSVKDLIAHVAAYENWTAAQIHAANEGRAPTNRELYGADNPSPALTGEDGWDLDRQNAAIHAHHKDASLPDVQEFSTRAFDNLLAAVEATSEGDLARPGAQPWTRDATLLAMVSAQSYGHYGMHINELRTIAGQDAI